ncbi:hypothetical protein LTR27_002573 [Elasticomyces elasticus]|nr:hypothetical protein LTR27_002573 [Elasticomyces elasticus]
MSGAPAKKACWHFALGQCDYSKDTCKTGDHPDALDAGLFASEDKVDFQLESGEGGCTRCLSKYLVCDKKGRGEGVEDPCSECRWFGGPGCKCTITNKSYNDFMFKEMLNRPKEGYTLPPFKHRSRGSGKKNPDALPMLDTELKEGWSGKTREELIDKEDMLPSHVREVPRAYLTFPRQSAGAAKATEYHERQESKKRKHEEPSQANDYIHPGLATPKFPTVKSEPMPQPPEHPVWGEALYSFWSWKSKCWGVQYERNVWLEGQDVPAQTLAALDERASKIAKLADRTVQREVNQPTEEAAPVSRHNGIEQAQSAETAALSQTEARHNDPQQVIGAVVADDDLGSEMDDDETAQETSGVPVTSTPEQPLQEIGAVPADDDYGSEMEVEEPTVENSGVSLNNRPEAHEKSPQAIGAMQPDDDLDSDEEEDEPAQSADATTIPQTEAGDDNQPPQVIGAVPPEDDLGSEMGDEAPLSVPRTTLPLNLDDVYDGE